MQAVSVEQSLARESDLSQNNKINFASIGREQFFPS